MSIKIDEFERRIGKVVEMESRLCAKHMEQGYICGLVNGLRIARGVITGDGTVLEREEVQPAGDTGSRIVLEKRRDDGELEYVLMKFDLEGGLKSMETL